MVSDVLKALSCSSLPMTGWLDKSCLPSTGADDTSL